MLQHGEWKLFCIIVDWQYDNRSLKTRDSCSIRAPCTRRDGWVLQVLPVSQESVSSRNKYMPAFHYLSKCGISFTNQPATSGLKVPMSSPHSADLQQLGNAKSKCHARSIQLFSRRKGRRWWNAHTQMCVNWHQTTPQIHWSSCWMSIPVAGSVHYRGRYVLH